MSTPRLGLSQFGGNLGGDISDGNHKFSTRDRHTLDRFLAALEGHRHAGGVRLADPSGAPSLTLLTDGGSLPAGTTFYYRISYVDAHGLETAAGTEASVTTASPIGTPTAPALQAQAGGTLAAGTYYYGITAYQSAGGETTVSQSSVLTIISPNGTIEVAVPPVPADADGYRIYRMAPGQPQMFLVGTTATSTFVDTGLAEQLVTPPIFDSTNSTNRVVIGPPDDVQAAGTLIKRWRIYRSQVSGVYDGNNLVHEVVETTEELGTILVDVWDDDGEVLFDGAPLETSTTFVPPDTAIAVPSGGTEGQALVKASAADYDLEWGNVVEEFPVVVEVWVDWTSGNNANDGVSQATPVKTIERALEVASFNNRFRGDKYDTSPTDVWIYLIGDYVGTGANSDRFWLIGLESAGNVRLNFMPWGATSAVGQTLVVGGDVSVAFWDLDFTGSFAMEEYGGVVWASGCTFAGNFNVQYCDMPIDMWDCTFNAGFTVGYSTIRMYNFTFNGPVNIYTSLVEVGNVVFPIGATLSSDWLGGLPDGGTAGQRVTKASAQEYDVEWTDDPDRVDVANGGMETYQDHGQVAGATPVEDIDLANGNVHRIEMGADLTLTFTGATAGVACTFRLLLAQDATGSRLATWPGSVRWSGGTEPTLSTATSAIDVFRFMTVDGGTTWFGFTEGQAMA